MTRRPASTATPLSKRRPWDDRFIHEDSDEETRADKTKQRERNLDICRGKENVINNNSASKQMRQYTERADGDEVEHFFRCEITPTSALKKKPYSSKEDNDLVGTRSVGTSPFDMDRVREALEADARHGNDPETVDTPIGEELTEHNHRRDSILLPRNKSEAVALLRKFEDLLYATELEEAILADYISREERESYGNNAHQTSCERKIRRARPSIPQQRREEILEYANESDCRRNEHYKMVTKNGHLQFHQIAEILADEMLHSCLSDIAEEMVHGCINQLAEEVFTLL